MDYGTADGPGALRRERLRTARLYFVCDAMPHGEDPEPLLRSALDGGVDMIQLRDKSGDDRLIERAAGTFRRLADTYSVPFMINDDPELVERFGADGVHVGQDDMAVSEVRKIVGREALVGLSTHSPEQLEAAIQAGGVDYLSAGPIWETPTKEGRPATGLDYISFA
ncbi:MAG: thiamine phosphate synthase, partial [Solirubrobacterales bacterium]